MMRWLLVMLVGCNWFYGLEDTRVADELPRVCPPIGETPMYTKAPVFITSGAFVNSYTFDELKTLAVGTRSGKIVEGPVDMDAFAESNLPRNTTETQVPRLSPEGDELFLERQIGVSSSYTLERYRREGTAWVATTAPNITLEVMSTHSVPTRRNVENGRRIVIARTTAVDEYRETAGAWSLVRSYSSSELQVSTPSEAHISPDGLRLVFNANDPGSVITKVRYTDRASSLDSFALPAREMFQLSGNTTPNDPFMTWDCNRLYYTSHPGVTYVQL